MWLRHVSLSKTAIGTFLRETHPGSEMATQNDQNGMFAKKMTKMTQKARLHKMAIYGAIKAVPFALGGP